MKKSKSSSTFKDILQVTISNIISLSSSILNGFVIPVILGTLNYGYYKIFALYASYTLLFHFGFNDGILLSYSGKHYDDLNKYNFRSNTIFFIIFQMVIALLIMSMAIFTANHIYKILFILLGINDFVQNLLGYYQNISQTIMKFTEYSIVNTLQNLLLIAFVLLILVYCKFYNSSINFVPYVIIIIFINTILSIWSVYYYRTLTFGTHPSLFSRFKYFKKYFITGFYMTFGYGIALLLFNLDSQFVIHFFSTRTYGIYAFAYSMFSAGLIILGAAAVVILPHLKTHSKDYILSKYSNNISYILLLVYLAIVGYFPLKLILYKFIYEYYYSLVYFRILLPGMAITCCVSIIISNYYYALKKVKFYFYLNLVVFIISFLSDYVFYLIFKTPKSLALSSTLSLLIWFIIANFFIVKWYGVKWIKNLSYIIVMMISFFLISNCNNIFLGLILYLIIYMIISLILFKENILYILRFIL